MNNLLKLSRAIDALLNALGRVASFALLGLVIIVVFDVVTRRFIRLGSTQLQEAEWHLHTILIMFFLGATFIHNQHIRIDLVHDKLSARGKALVELMGILLLLFPFCAITGYYAVEFAYTSFIRNEISQSVDGLPYRWAIKSMLPLGIILLALAGVSRLAKSFAVLRDPTRYELNTLAEGSL